jgi:hypothetical protein
MKQADEIELLRSLLKRTLPMISGAGCAILAAEINNAIGVPNVELTGDALLRSPS